jgi:hypothetical protein
VQAAVIEAGTALAAAAAIVLSPFGRRTLREVGRDGLMPRHARHMGHVMLVVALLVAVAAALNAR